VVLLEIASVPGILVYTVMSVLVLLTPPGV
jgi:hypothetical protein